MCCIFRTKCRWFRFEAALETARKRLGSRAAEVRWIEADITSADLPANHFDVWHDRAVFHFLTQAAERAAYALHHHAGRIYVDQQWPLSVQRHWLRRVPYALAQNGSIFRDSRLEQRNREPLQRP